jgi:hypothetical protein
MVLVHCHFGSAEIFKLEFKFMERDTWDSLKNGLARKSRHEEGRKELERNRR